MKKTYVSFFISVLLSGCNSGLVIPKDAPLNNYNTKSMFSYTTPGYSTSYRPTRSRKFKESYRVEMINNIQSREGVYRKEYSELINDYKKKYPQQIHEWEQKLLVDYSPENVYKNRVKPNLDALKNNKFEYLSEAVRYYNTGITSYSGSLQAVKDIGYGMKTNKRW